MIEINKMFFEILKFEFFVCVQLVPLFIFSVAVQKYITFLKLSIKKKFVKRDIDKFTHLDDESGFGKSYILEGFRGD